MCVAPLIHSSAHEDTMHSVQVFYGAAVATPVTDFPLPAIADQTLNVYNNTYQFLTPRTLMKSFAGVPNGTAVRLNAPSFAKGFQPTIDPIDGAATIGGTLPPICDYMGRGPDIPKQENFQPLITRTGGVAADCAIVIWTCPTFVPAPPGKAFTIRMSAAATGAKGQWNLSSLTPDQNLPNGKFSVIGMRVEGANCLTARLVFPGQAERPGCLCNVDQTSWVYPSFRFGYGGMFGAFINTNLPQIEVLGFGAVASQFVYLDCIQQA